MKIKYPLARTDSIVVQEINDEILVCDTTNNRVFCLNRTAGEVWKACDGKTNAQQLAKDLSRRFDKNVSEEMVSFSLIELSKENLLQAKVDSSMLFNGVSRREIIKRVGLTSMIALPLISSIAIPTAAQAASGTLAFGSACASNGQCTSNFCTDGVCCNTACLGICQACTAAKKASGSDGTCNSISVGNDPDNECPGATNCSGFNTCALFNIGTACTINGECSSGNCVDGVCCNSPCDGTCQACTTAKKGSGSNGTCGNVAAGTDPDLECPGTCNGAGACA
jgi:hypothetical protein